MRCKKPAAVACVLFSEAQELNGVGQAAVLPAVNEAGAAVRVLGEAAEDPAPVAAKEKFVSCVEASNPSCPESVCPSISACDVKPTSEPFVWGPGMWHSLHIMAVNFPVSPDEARKQHCAKFLEALPYMLPCGECGRHLQDKMKEVPGIAAISCASRAALNNFMVGMHNHVNKQLGKKVWTTAEAANRYSKQHICVKNATTWKAANPL